MNVHGGNWPRAMAHRLGMGGVVDFTPTRVGQTLHVPCRGRGKHEPHIVDVPIPAHQHPDAVAKRLLNAGWMIGGNKLLCPDAARGKARGGIARASKLSPERKTEIARSAANARWNKEEGMEMASLGITTTPQPEETPKPTPAAGRAKRLVFMALEDYYDDQRKAYKTGHSDDTIAKEAGVSEACVKQIREESFGPLAVPLDLRNFENDITELRRQVDAANLAHKTALDGLEKQLAALIKKNGWNPTP